MKRLPLLSVEVQVLIRDPAKEEALVPAPAIKVSKKRAQQNNTKQTKAIVRTCRNRNSAGALIKTRGGDSFRHFPELSPALRDLVGTVVRQKDESY